MIYLASLFSNGATTDSGEHKMVREQRYLYTLKHLARLINNGEFVSYNENHNKSPNLVVEYLKAKKSKICPMIKWED